MTNDYDLDGHDLTIIGVGTDAINGLTTNGGTVSINDNNIPTDSTDDFIDYSPPTGFTGNDTFQYEVTDGFGGTAIAM